MTPKLVDEYEYINRRLREIEEEKERARNTCNDPATEPPKEADNHEWSFSIDNIYPG